MKKILCLMLSAFVILSAPDLVAYPTPSMGQNSINSTTINWCETYTESIQRAKNSSKPLLILFTGTSWCPACIKLEREVLQKPEFARATANNFVFYKAEFNDPSPEGLDSTPDSVLLDRYQIDAFPTIVAVDGNGNRLFTVNYQTGGPEAYIREINQKLQSSRNNLQQNYPQQNYPQQNYR